jgi:hypothetical protein
MRSTRLTAAAAAGSSSRSGASSEFSEYSAIRSKLRGLVDQFEQFGAGLLLGRIDVLIALDDIDINGQLVGMGVKGAVALGDRG